MKELKLDKDGYLDLTKSDSDEYYLDLVESIAWRKDLKEKKK